MKVKLTGGRKDWSGVLYGVEFEKGKGELNQEQVSKGVFERLLKRYMACEEVKTKSKDK